MKTVKIFILISALLAGCQQIPVKPTPKPAPPAVVRFIAVVACKKPLAVLVIDATGGVTLLTTEEFDFLASDPDFKAVDTDHRDTLTVTPPGGCALTT